MNDNQTDILRAMLLQLRNAYLAEMPEKFDSLERLLLEIEKSGTNIETFNELYRIVHSLKGSGGTHGLHIITSICHQLEDVLNLTDGGAKFTPELISISLEYIDLLRAATEQIQSDNESFPKVEEQLNKLRRQLAKKKYKVLLVDNSKLSTDIYLQVLSKNQIQTVVMRDGISALTRALTEPFDLIITTNEVPMLSGIALIGALKLSKSRSRNTKTILITSNKIAANSQSQTTDPDYTVIKDGNLSENLSHTIMLALSIPNRPCTFDNGHKLRVTH